MFIVILYIYVYISLISSTSICVDLSTELNRSLESLGHEFEAAVGWNIDLEEAGVRQRQAVLCVATVVSKLMLVLEAGDIRRNPGSTPQEFEILGSLFLREGLEHRPEPLVDLIVFAAIVLSDSLQLINFNELLTARSGFDLVPGQK